MACEPLAPQAGDLAQRIAALIAAQGPLSVAQFMTMALHDPNAGYYATRDPLGTCGDFVTAPEISQIFGELIGLWCVQVWRDQGSPSPARLVELGPGRGTLMADALRAARAAPDFLDAVDVALVEASPVLRATQMQRLAGCGARVRWHEQFDARLADRPFWLIANEFFDALPIRQFVCTARGWCERMIVARDDGSLAFALAPVATLFADGENADPGAVREFAPAAAALAETIARAIAHHGGAALIVDYGYEQGGFADTLQAVAPIAFGRCSTRPERSTSPPMSILQASPRRPAGAAPFAQGLSHRVSSWKPLAPARAPGACRRRTRTRQ